MIIRAGRYCGMEVPPKMPNFVLEEHMAKQLEVIVSNPYMTCQRLIPFQKWRSMQCMNLGAVIFEFGPCNIYGICYIEPFLFSCLNANCSSEWTTCRTSHTPWFVWPFLLCCLITNSSSEWTVCCISHTPSFGCPFLLFLLMQTVNWIEPYALHCTRN